MKELFYLQKEVSRKTSHQHLVKVRYWYQNAVILAFFNVLIRPTDQPVLVFGGTVQVQQVTG